MNKFWIRYCFRNLGALDTDYLSLDECKQQIQQDLSKNEFIQYCYIMTTDAFGECFYDLIRRETA